MKYTKTTFVNDSNIPALDATWLNAIGAATEYLAKMGTEKAAFSGSSTALNYIITITGYTVAPTSGELPMVVIFTPTITNDGGVMITTNWGTTYSLYDISTNAQIQQAEVKANQPITTIFDGSKFWVNSSGAFLKFGLAAGMEGYFHRGTTAPSGSMRLTYNGDFYASKVNGAVYNASGADIAEGYSVVGDYEFGDLISINTDGTFSVNEIECNTKVIGFVSKEGQYAALYGTDYGETPVAKLGRVKVRVSGSCTAGDYLCACAERGCVKSIDIEISPRGSIVAQALETKTDSGIQLVLVDLVRL